MAATKTRTSKTRKSMTAEQVEQAKAVRAECVARLEAAAESFEIDEDDNAMMKAFIALCVHYSENNSLLILAQAEQLGVTVSGPEDVAAFGTWRDRGRSVRKGEHRSIFIWQPAGSSAQADKTDETAPAVAPEGTQGEAKVRKFFKVGGLFHISQTDEIKPED
jgi:hypothetical protein